MNSSGMERDRGELRQKLRHLPRCAVQHFERNRKRLRNTADGVCGYLTAQSVAKTIYLGSSA